MDNRVDWLQYVDVYCERTAPGFWGEPVNALTNVALLMAAALLARDLRDRVDARGRPAAPRSLWVLTGLVAVIAVASFLTHTFATRWASLAHVLSIYLFMVAYAPSFLRRAIGWGWGVAWIGAPAFVLLTQAVGQLVPPETFGMGGFMPALLVLSAFAGWLALRRDPRWQLLASAGVLFALSLTLRQFDLPMCTRMPVGTHFLWHLLNAVVLYLVTRALMPAPGQSPAPRYPTP